MAHERALGKEEVNAGRGREFHNASAAHPMKFS